MEGRIEELIRRVDAIVGKPGGRGFEDCNLNGAPDKHDIAVGTSADVLEPKGIPDECAVAGAGARPGQESHWSADIWGHAKSRPDDQERVMRRYPDDLRGVPRKHVTIPPDWDILLDQTVQIRSLQLKKGATLRVKNGGLTVVGPEGIHLEGALKLGAGSQMTVLGPFIIGDGGSYGATHPEQGSDPTVASVTINNNGSWNLPGENWTVLGDFKLYDTDGGMPPPVFTASGSGGTIVIGGSFIIDCEPGTGSSTPHPTVRLETVPPPLITVARDFKNESTVASDFKWSAVLRFTQTGASIEAAGEDKDASAAGLSGNFSIKTLEIPSGIQVGVVDTQNNYTVNTRPEALYVETLTLDSGAKLETVYPAKVYYKTWNNGGTLTGDIHPITLP